MISIFVDVSSVCSLPLLSFLLSYYLFILSMKSFTCVIRRVLLFQGLVVSKNKQEDAINLLPESRSDQDPSVSTVMEHLSKDDDHLCPICHEKLTNQKMVFQCGHATCCKCKSLTKFQVLI